PRRTQRGNRCNRDSVLEFRTPNFPCGCNIHPSTTMSAAQHMEWLSLVEKTGPFLAVGVLDEAFPQGLEKVETRKRQRIRSAYDEWRDAVDGSDPEIEALHREWINMVLRELLEYQREVLKSASEIPAVQYHEPLTGADLRPDWVVMAGDSARILIKH